VTGKFTDGSFLAVHSENNGVAGTGTGDGFNLSFNNVRLTHCKSSINVNGYTFDAPGTGSSNPIAGAEGIKLTGCSSDGNTHNGLNILNSSTTGTSSRAPVTISNYSSAGDGSGSGSGGIGAAGIYIAGKNVVYISNALVTGSTNSGGSMYPDYGLHLATAGSGPGFPEIVSVVNAVFNGALNGNVPGAGASNTSIQVDSGAWPSHGLTIGPGVYGYAGSVYREQAGTANLVLPAQGVFTPADPSGTTATGGVMMGLGSTCALTPVGSGQVLVTVTGTASIATGVTNVTISGRYGTSTAPANGAAVTGTKFGPATDTVVRPVSATTGAIGFAITTLLSLTPGTAYWFDLMVKTASGSDAASVESISMTMSELA
jgi:hypothetical protein